MQVFALPTDLLVCIFCRSGRFQTLFRFGPEFGLSVSWSANDGMANGTSSNPADKNFVLRTRSLFVVSVLFDGMKTSGTTLLYYLRWLK